MTIKAELRARRVFPYVTKANLRMYVGLTGMMIQHNQEIAQLSPDPFPPLRAGSGDETNGGKASGLKHHVRVGSGLRPLYVIVTDTRTPGTPVLHARGSEPKFTIGTRMHSDD